MKLALPDIKTILKNHKFLLTTLLVVILLRIPSLFEPYWYGDEGVYLTLGEGIRRGLLLYRDIYDNKPPLLYLINAIAGNLFWLRFILLVWNLMTIYLFFLLSKTLLPKNQKASQVAVLIFGIFSSLPLIEGNIANAEIFMILPTIAALVLIFSQKQLTRRIWLTAGILFSLAALFKVPAIFDFAAVLIFLVFFQSRRLLFTILGFSLPILVTLAYFWSQGTLNQYLAAAFFQNLPYLSSWQTGSHSQFVVSGLMLRAIILVASLVALWQIRKKLNYNLTFLLIWFLFALFGATLSGRPYPHYLLQVLPAASLLIASLPEARLWPKATILSLLGLLILAVFYFRFWSYPNFGYYQNFSTFALGQKNQEDYFRWFNPKVPQTYQLAQFLITHTEPNEKVFIWGDSPIVYALSRRLPAGRYTASYHIIDLKAQQETIEVLEKEKPRFIIDLHDEKRPFPKLKILLGQKYLSSITVGQAEIFRLAPR